MERKIKKFMFSHLIVQLECKSKKLHVIWKECVQRVFGVFLQLRVMMSRQSVLLYWVTDSSE